MARWLVPGAEAPRRFPLPVGVVEVLHHGGHGGLARRCAPLVAALAAGGAIAVGLSATADYVVRRLTAPRPPGLPLHLGFTPFETGVEWQEVAFPAEDGTCLGGWLLDRGPAAPAILACGGYRGRRSDLLGIGSSLWRSGFTVLLFDYRGYGDEPGPVTLGYRELADARAALHFLRTTYPHTPRGAIGFSMGAAIAIMLAARERDVQAVWADSPFTSQREIVHFHLTREFGLRPSPPAEAFAKLLLDLVDRKLFRRFGFRFDEVQPLRDVTQLAPRPLVIVHGEDDDIVPFDHGVRLAAAAQEAGVPVETWFLAGCGHCGAYFLDRRRYVERASGFFKAYLHPPDRFEPSPPEGTAVPALPAAGASGVSRRPQDSELVPR